MENRLKAQLTHVENEAFCIFHEDIMAVTGKGMHPTVERHNIPLEKRWRNSKNLAKHLNKLGEDLPENLKSLQNDLRNFRLSLSKNNIKVDNLDTANWSIFDVTWRLIYTVLLAPFALLGLIHVFPIKFFVKKWVEKTMKRPVFWGSTKAVVGMFGVCLFNVILIFGLSAFFEIPLLFSWIYFLSIGFFYLALLTFRTKFSLIKNALTKRKLLKEKNVQRLELNQRINQFFNLD